MLSSVSGPVTLLRSMTTSVVTPALVTEIVKLSAVVSPGTGAKTWESPSTAPPV